MPPTFESEFPGLARALHGQLVVERELGRGGMGVVYFARDVMLDRAVAMKVLPPHLAAQEEMRERFLREARTAARLAHPNVVPVYRADEIDGAAFFTMAFVEGEALAERIRDRGPLAAAEGVRIFREVAWALAYAHARGVVHRDVKPENILLDRQTGRALVSDFGIARQADASRLTQAGLVLGTFHYMSPEQVSGAELDGRSDAYSLGVVMYQALSGKLPFDGLTAPAVLMAHATKRAPPLHTIAPNVPASLVAIVDRCLEKRAEDRFPNCEMLADALDDALEAVPSAIQSLPEGMPPVISEAQAAAIWQRAARLQADALQRLEQRNDLMPAGTSLSTSASVPSGGYKLVDVAAAAEEAGISRQYVAMALAEIPRGGLAVESTSAEVSERVATRYLGTTQRSLAVSVTVNASPARALRALGEALRQAPYSLVVRETIGAHPLDGGVIVFDLPAGLVSASTGESLNYWMGLRQQLEARQVQVTLRPMPGDPTSTEVTMTADLRPGVRRNVITSKWIAGIVGGLSGGLIVVGTELLLKSAAAAVLGITGVGGVAVAAAMGGVSLLGYRSLYRSTLNKARGEMLRALESIAATMRAEDVFGAPIAGSPAGDLSARK